MHYVCHECGKKYDTKELIFRCTCNGLLDLEDFHFDFSKEDIQNNNWSLFRYEKAIPLDQKKKIWRDVTMGEGFTPLVPLDKDHPNFLVKLDYAMPTLSFKDRGAVVLISKAKELGIKKVIQDSSGNAGTSIAAYSKRAGIDCDIYVPQNTSTKKIKQIQSYGAKVHIVPGSREDTAKAALAAVERKEGFYASHVYNPYFYQGTKTYVYEIYEQLGYMADTLIIPVGNGTLLLGAYYGLKDLLRLGLIHKLPRLIGVQAHNCAPIYQSFDQVDFTPTNNIGTLAEGIAIADPKRGKQIVNAIKETGGTIFTAKENNILEAKTILSQKGFYVETTTAATFSAFFDHQKEFSSEKVILPLCGTGLKSES